MDYTKLSEFLDTHNQVGLEAAAILSPGAHYTQVLCKVTEGGFAVTQRYDEAIGLLAQGLSVAVTAEQELPSDLYDLLRQFCQRRGIIQVLPKAKSETPLLQLDTERTKILLVIPEEHEERNRQRYPDLFNFIGAVERL